MVKIYILLKQTFVVQISVAKAFKLNSHIFIYLVLLSKNKHSMKINNKMMTVIGNSILFDSGSSSESCHFNLFFKYIFFFIQARISSSHIIVISCFFGCKKSLIIFIFLNVAYLIYMKSYKK